MAQNSLNYRTITKRISSGKLRPPKLPMILAGVFVLVIVGWLVYTGIQKASELYKYSYSLMNSYTAPGAVTGSGMSFSKPIELTKLTNSAGQTELEHVLGPGNKKGLVAYIAAVSTIETSAYTQAQLDALKANLAYPDDNYNSVVSPINQFIKDRLPSDWQIKLDNSKPFTNPYVKDNAWQFSFSTSDPKNKKNSFNGETLYVISGKNYYYFMLATVLDNWQPNQKVWQQVIDSLKIDQ